MLQKLGQVECSYDGIAPAIVQKVSSYKTSGKFLGRMQDSHWWSTLICSKGHRMTPIKRPRLSIVGLKESAQDYSPSGGNLLTIKENKTSRKFSADFFDGSYWYKMERE